MQSERVKSFFIIVIIIIPFCGCKGKEFFRAAQSSFIRKNGPTALIIDKKVVPSRQRNRMIDDYGDYGRD
jgi:hypothetical protein